MSWGSLRFSSWKKLGVAAQSLNSMSLSSMLVTYYHVCKWRIQSLSCMFLCIREVPFGKWLVDHFKTISCLFILFFPCVGISCVQQDPFTSKPRKLLPRKFLKISLRCAVGFSILYVVSSWEVTLRKLVEINCLILVLNMKGKLFYTLVWFVSPSSWDSHGGFLPMLVLM